MRTAGVREARQNLSVLLEEVRKGHEVVITQHGRKVARIVPHEGQPCRPFRGRAALRASVRLKGPGLSETIREDREDRV